MTGDNHCVRTLTAAPAFCLAGLAWCWLTALPAIADNWSGSIRSKLQTDNRYNRDGDYTGEVWGQFAYTNPERQLNARISTLGRASTDIYREDLKVYQAFLEKALPDWSLTLKGGRFERSDSLGLYLLDGASAGYSFNGRPFTLEVYAGRPLRVDHVRSLDAAWIAGAEGLLKLAPHWSFAAGGAQINVFDLRLGLQSLERNQLSVLNDSLGEQLISDDQFDADESGSGGIVQQHGKTTYRINGTAHFAGHLLAQDKPLELFLQASYAADKSRLENVMLDSWWDPLKGLRIRNYLEAYRPRQPYVSFRDRFYSAYALGEQRVWRGSAEYAYNERLKYSVGLQAAGRDQGYSGTGLNAGLSYQWRPGFNLRGEYDYLELNSGESANSVYLSASHAMNAKTRYLFNLAWRVEDKLLYGHNQARGIENEVHYMLDSSIILAFKGSYIDNTALSNEYLAALQLTYYFDRFQARTP